jgi:hypothetical protein
MFIVIYERQVIRGKFARFVLDTTVYDDWPLADLRAKQIAADFKVRSWIAEVQNPPLFETVETAERIRKEDLPHFGHDRDDIV